MRVVAGIGAGSQVTAEEVEAALAVAAETGEIVLLASIDRRAGTPALVEAARRRAIPVVGFTAEELDAVPGVSGSDRARTATGAGSVAEAAAVLASGTAHAVLARTVVGRVTVAAARYLH